MREREIELQRLDAEMNIQRERQELELLELQQLKAEMNNQREIQELELEERRIDLENVGQEKTEDPNPLLLIIVVINILCAIWVYLDIQKRTRESGIWIVIALLTGLLGTLVYAIVRLGEGTKPKA
ncbi:hypothetical protein ACFLZ8_05035 [Planctomycetota bacterium]